MPYASLWWADVVGDALVTAKSAAMGDEKYAPLPFPVPRSRLSLAIEARPPKSEMSIRVTQKAAGPDTRRTREERDSQKAVTHAFQTDGKHRLAFSAPPASSQPFIVEEP